MEMFLIVDVGCLAMSGVDGKIYLELLWFSMFVCDGLVCIGVTALSLHALFRPIATQGSFLTL